MWKLPSEIARIQPRNLAHAPSPSPIQTPPAPKRLKPQIPAKVTCWGLLFPRSSRETLFPTPRQEPAALKESPTAARRLIWSPRGSFKVDHPVLNS